MSGETSIFPRHDDVIFQPVVPFEQQAEIRKQVRENRKHWLEALAEVGMAAALMQGGQYAQVAQIIGNELNLTPNMKSIDLVNLILQNMGKNPLFAAPPSSTTAPNNETVTTGGDSI